MDQFRCPFIDCTASFPLSVKASVLATHLRKAHPKLALPLEFKLPEHITLEQCSSCMQLFNVQRGAFRKHRESCKDASSSESKSQPFSSGVSSRNAPIYPANNRVGKIASVLWQVKSPMKVPSQSFPPHSLNSHSALDSKGPSQDSKSKREAHLDCKGFRAGADRPLPSLIQVASHGSLRRTLAKDCWPSFRAVCRNLLVGYALASKNGDEKLKLKYLVELLNVPAQALLIRNGNTKRTNAEVNQALRDILQRKWLAEHEVNAVSKNTSSPETDPISFKIKKAIALVKAGHISRATKSLFRATS